MRFQLEYKDYKEESIKNKNLTLLESFLNFHLVEKFHGWTYECIFVTIINNATRTKTDTAKKYLECYAKVEINGLFESNRSYNLHDFHEGFQLIKRLTQLVNEIPVEETDYDAPGLMSDLENLQDRLPQTEAELIQLSKQKQEMDDAFQLKRVNGYLKASTEHPQALTKRLIGIRIYDHFDKGALMPYVYMYGEIFGTLLRNEKLLTPYYKEIYFGIAGKMDDAKRNSPLAIRYWHKYTYSTLDIDKYESSTEQEKEKMVFESICEGLRLIAYTDHLDKEKVEKVISYIEKEGVNTTLTYKTEENENYKVEIIYKMLPDHTKSISFYLLLTDKKSGKSNTVLVNNFDTWWAPYSFGKILIKKKEIIIKSRGGLRGEVSRKQDGLPDEHKFIISDILNDKASDSASI